ncbi:Mucin-associated surface protein (MASP), subgroup S079 [Trypanosoma cruzi]|nr:Mucin-associated surface protein (MASP), subgroup S079 [Trypanosoma cruzi]
MAMMMTGRVLLVCALCVLWCGAGGGFANEEKTGLGSDGEPLPESQELGTSRKGTQELKVGSQDIKEKVPPESSLFVEVADDEDSNLNEEEETTEDTEKEQEENNKAPNQTHEGKKNEGGSLPPPPSIPSGSSPTEPKNSQNPKKVTNEATPSGPKMDSEAPAPPSEDATQGRQSHDTDTEDSTKNAITDSSAETTTSFTSASGSGDHVQNKADEDDAQSPEGQHYNLETGNTNVVPKLSETASQTPETATARINVTTTPGDSDGSTAVSHTTSRLLLLLLVVACAAAVVAA